MTFNCRSYIDALSADVQRVYSKTHESRVPQQKVFSMVFFFSSSGKSHLPAANSEKESQDVRLFLLLKFFDVFEGTHLKNC